MVDGTLGLGGHAREFLSRYPGLQLVGIDVDREMLAIARGRLTTFGARIRFEQGWSGDVLNRPPIAAIPVDRILLDLGVSQHHFVASGRGFSFRGEEPLDMRLDDHGSRTAADIVNDETQQRLADLIFELGGERHSRRIAAAIVDLRRGERIMTTAQLEQVIWRATPARDRHRRIHPATRTFQALRIAVNGELEQLEISLRGSVERLVAGGRIGVIAFHSLEDRIVKRFLRESRDLNVLTPKPIRPTKEETAVNPPSRSARLRVAERVAEGGYE
jgi:16S rRNA (cytosine1402-N4)-methyltransferase